MSLHEVSFQPAEEWTFIVTKRARQSQTSNTALTDDTHIQIPVIGGEFYHYELMMVYEGANATMDMKYGYALSAGTFTRYVQKHLGTGPTTTVIQEAAQVGSAAATTTTVTVATGGSGEVNWTWNLGYFIPSADATFKLQWAQNVSDGGALTVLENTRLKVLKVL